VRHALAGGTTGQFSPARTRRAQLLARSRHRPRVAARKGSGESGIHPLYPGDAHPQVDCPTLGIGPRAEEGARVTFSHGGATFLVPLLLFGWPLIVALLFLRMPGRDAALWAFILGFLFLPEGAYVIQGVPEYTKQSATSLAVFVCSLVLDGGRVFRWRVSWIDFPIFLWCSGRVATSVSNGLGVYDGLSNLLLQLTSWGLPYWIGRTYFSDAAGLRALARGIVIGGLIYLPLCLWELRFSPQLHRILYGFQSVPFMMTKRYDGYRPILFTQSSLLVGMWMAAATVSCAWLSTTGLVKRIFNIPTRWLVYPLAVTTILCKTLGASALMVIGVVMAHCAVRLRWKLPVVAALVLFGSYPALRGVGIIDAESVLSLTESIANEERQSSLGVRLRSEEMYIDHVAERPVLGWGGWGRGDVVVEGLGRSVPDGLWVIALSRAGWLAVVALALMYLLPALSLVRRNVQLWKSPELAGFATLAVVLLLYWVDCLSNAMLNPILLLALGAGAGGVVAPSVAFGPAAAPAPASEPPPQTPAEVPLARAALGRSLRGRRAR
jgi:hypothetical protein